MLPDLPNPPIHRSLAEIPEHELIQLLMAQRHGRDFMFGIKGMPNNPRVLMRVPLAGAPGGVRGDVDLLLVEPLLPLDSVAIEVKRVRVGARSFEPAGKPNKLSDYREGVRQANLLAEIGFAQVYLYVLVVVDSRIRNKGKYSYDGITPELQAEIDAVVTLDGLNPRAGLVVSELVQSMDYEPLTLGAGGGHLRRLATPAIQPAALTAWVTDVVS
jgi:hypothetical protein